MLIDAEDIHLYIHYIPGGRGLDYYYTYGPNSILIKNTILIQALMMIQLYHRTDVRMKINVNKSRE